MSRASFNEASRKFLQRDSLSHLVITQRQPYCFTLRRNLTWHPVLLSVQMNSLRRGVVLPTVSNCTNHKQWYAINQAGLRTALFSTSTWACAPLRATGTTARVAGQSAGKMFTQFCHGTRTGAALRVQEPIYVIDNKRITSILLGPSIAPSYAIRNLSGDCSEDLRCDF